MHKRYRKFGGINLEFRYTKKDGEIGSISKESEFEDPRLETYRLLRSLILAVYKAENELSMIEKTVNINPDHYLVWKYREALKILRNTIYLLSKGKHAKPLNKPLNAENQEDLCEQKFV